MMENAQNKSKYMFRKKQTNNTILKFKQNKNTFLHLQITINTVIGKGEKYFIKLQNNLISYLIRLNYLTYNTNMYIIPDKLIIITLGKMQFKYYKNLIYFHKKLCSYLFEVPCIKL